MAREFMVGTVDDKPLLIVRDGPQTYFLDLDSKEVFADKPGLPQVTDVRLIARLVKIADTQK